MLKRCLAIAWSLCLVATSISPAVAQTSAANLLVTVVDQAGGVLPGARVTIVGPDGGAPGQPRTASTTASGVAEFGRLTVGRYSVRVELAGFTTATIRDIDVTQRVTSRLVTLNIRFDESVDVERDDALDPSGPAFSTLLTREMIDALPDDPDEMEAVLIAMAPPGAAIFVDGFAGGALPPKYLIRAIRVPRMDNMAAQYHGVGDALRIEIQTQPGIGPIRGRLDTTFFDDGFSARNPFTPEKGDEQTRQGGVSVAGTLVPGLMSFSANASASAQHTSPNVLAVLMDGTRVAQLIRRPATVETFGARVDYALNADHSLRVSFDWRSSETRNLGVGGFNLETRAFRTTSTSNMLRLAENGPVGRRMYFESRAQVEWSSSEDVADVEMPTTVVIGSFTSGGAQVTGGERAVSVDVSADLDYIRGAHAWRAGVRVDGGRYTSDDNANYLGTYTFSSLADFNAGRPSNYTRRIGVPDIAFSAWRTGVYVEDDWRAARSVLISAGLRAGFQTLTGDRLNLSPRLTLGWAPFGDGGVTLRASYGYLYDWIPDLVFKQTQLIDGFRLREINIVNPSYPEPSSAGATSATNRYLWSNDLPLPTTHRVVIGAEKYLTRNQQVSGTYAYGRGRDVLRGRNLNPSVGAVRPDPTFANVVELVADAGARNHAVALAWNLTKAEWRRLILVTNYTWSRSDTNTTGPFALPASGDAPGTEWGPSAPAHQGNAAVNVRLFEHGRGSGMGVSLNAQARSGSPYNVTTGRDGNRDGVFNDRPAGVARNSARTAAFFSLNGAMNYQWRFGPARLAPDGTPQPLPRYVVAWSLAFTNLTNHDNFIGYSGVETSPFFGRPTNVSTPRRVQISVRFDF